MSKSFTKLFSSITESTVWCEPLATRIVWITMLAMADRNGRVWASVPGLANRARVALEEAETALARFTEPDRYSRTPAHDGRRIEAIDGGWRLLNYAKYREMRDGEERREYQREWDRTKRQRHPTNPTKSDQIRPQPSQAEAEAKAEAEEKMPTPKAPSCSAKDPARFARWWSSYPRKVAKAAAQKTWARLRVSDELLEAMLRAIERQRRTEAWSKDGGAYVPHPATWLNGRRWEDELPVMDGKVGADGLCECGALGAVKDAGRWLCNACRVAA